jgi:molybdenum cofactor cytidylyltransferase
MTPVGILLCAGRGRRFDPGGSSNKLLQVLGAGDGCIEGDAGMAVVAASARHMLAILPHVVAVVPPGGDEVTALLTSLGCVVTVCPDADSGMAASLMHGIRHTQLADAWVVALGDMPFVQPSTISGLVKALENGASIAAPSTNGKRGNPVAFSSIHLPALLALQGDQGARGILLTNPVHEVAVDDAGILRDVDTPSDLHQPTPSKK